MTYINTCNFVKVVVVRQVDQHQDQLHDQQADQPVDRHRDKVVSHRADMDQLNH